MATISALGIGSGMDLNGLLDQLASAERQKLTPIAQQRQSVQTKISAYGRLEGALAQFRTAALQLNDAKLFGGVASEVNGSAVKAAATSEASPGSYKVGVTQLASAYSIASAGVADKTASLGTGSMTLTLANGGTVNVAEGDHSLESLRDAINAQDGGVQASIVNDGDPTNPWRLSLTSTETGSEAAIAQVDTTLALTMDTTTEVTAQNASLTVNGVTISSQSNQVKDAIQGVTLDLAEAGEATVTVSLDTPAIKKAVKGFVEAYNSLQSSMSNMTRFNAETGDAGALLSDGVLRRVQSQLRSEMSSGVTGGEFGMLSDIGITLQLDGKLKLDEERLDAVIADELPALQTFFAGDSKAGGLAGQLDATLGRMLDSQGTLEIATNGLKRTVDQLEQRYERMEVSIDSTIGRYRQQFAKLDSMVAQMNSTSGYLAQQFDMLNAQMGRKD